MKRCCLPFSLIRARFACLVSIFLIASMLDAVAENVDLEHVYYIKQDYGLIDRGLVAKSIKVNNPGTHDFSLERAIPSCGCIEIIRMPKLIKARTFENIDIRWNTTGYCGQVSQSISLVSDASPARVIKIELEGVVRGIDAKPKSIDFGSVPFNGTAARSL